MLIPPSRLSNTVFVNAAPTPFPISTPHAPPASCAKRPLAHTCAAAARACANDPLAAPDQPARQGPPIKMV
ncbi:unnamed protein product [Chondrus crispus]|uniref:Uncharacterized protein n=1 Tax=Chondrus crispus TaxID=2769 RepID=R7QHW0_CHOCR|nr:unnamed protein product [Chondrus crispus]CDF37041.1 unnamed protein product [Chondrus crispus]|eukprot:XP_005716860.1 unnamed protein product [Chondrus crispus]